MSCEEIHSLLFPCGNYCVFEKTHKHWNVLGELGTFVALGVRGRGMIENRSFNLVEFCVIMGKTNRDL